MSPTIIATLYNPHTTTSLYVTVGDLTWQPDGPVDEHLKLLSVLVVVESHLFENRECWEGDYNTGSQCM